MSTELAWAAGFFDGEGCFSIANHRKQGSRYLMAGIWQKDIRPLERFIRAVGEGDRKITYLAKKDCHAIVFQGSSAERVIAKLEPYLTEPKLEQLARVRKRLVSF